MEREPNIADLVKQARRTILRADRAIRKAHLVWADIHADRGETPIEGEIWTEIELLEGAVDDLREVVEALAGPTQLANGEWAAELDALAEALDRFEDRPTQP